MSPFKLGLSILWPAAWTALPLKMAFAVLFMAMGSIHLETKLGITFLMLLMSPVSVFAFSSSPWEWDSISEKVTGLPLLFLISIPIDIWALGLVGPNTLSREPAPGATGLASGLRFVGTVCGRGCSLSFLSYG